MEQHMLKVEQPLLLRAAHVSAVNMHTHSLHFSVFLSFMHHWVSLHQTFSRDKWNAPFKTWNRQTLLQAFPTFEYKAKVKWSRQPEMQPWKKTTAEVSCVLPLWWRKMHCCVIYMKARFFIASRNWIAVTEMQYLDLRGADREWRQTDGWRMETLRRVWWTVMYHGALQTSWALEIRATYPNTEAEDKFHLGNILGEIFNSLLVFSSEMTLLPDGK